MRVRPIAAALLALASTCALADGNSSAADNSGLMTFANVTVVNAAAPETSAPVTGTAGLRASKDQDTGHLRAPTAVEIQALDAMTSVEPETPVELSTMENGATMAKLNSAYMSYSVVQKNADGTLAEQCVTGESAADHALHEVTAGGEVSHDR
jgi:hypothetical protein